MRRSSASAFVLLALLLVSAGSASAIRWPWLRGDEREPVYPEVTASVDWLAGRLSDSGTVVVDARSEVAYGAGHIPGAISVPTEALLSDRSLDLEEVTTLLGGLGVTGRGRVVCCGDGLLDGSAAALFWALDAAGAENPMVLEGGLEAWTSGGHALEGEPATLPPGVWTGEPRRDRVASLAYVALKFGAEGHEIIDARGWDEWSGDAPGAIGQEAGDGMGDGGERVDTRRGHIPHALPYDFREFVSAEGGLLPAEDTREIFSRVGPRPSTPVDLWDEFIVHGRGGADGAIGYFLLRRAGIERLRYLQGGWRAWKEDRSLPVVRILSAEELLERLTGPRRWFRADAPPSDFALFDVRHWGDYATGHIPGAVALPSSVFADSLDLYLARHWPDSDRREIPVVTYCYGSNCIRSRNTATEAARRGFVKIERFYEGVDGWRLAGGELLQDRELLERMREEREEARRKAEERRAARAKEGAEVEGSGTFGPPGASSNR